VSILKLFGLSRERETASANEESGDGDSIRRIARELDALPDDQALHLATFAYVLGRVAHADSHFSEVETQKMQDIVQVLGHIQESQAVLLVEIAKHQVRLFGGTDNVTVSRRFRELSTPEQRIELLECVFAVSAADDSITVVEEGQARQISTELGLTHKEFVQARSAYVDHLEALKAFRAGHSGAGQ
tara:strand:- start:60 stop:620 length:561 start_codon:yes stop_codon:yes gene_type:complete